MSHAFEYSILNEMFSFFSWKYFTHPEKLKYDIEYPSIFSSLKFIDLLVQLAIKISRPVLAGCGGARL